MNRMKCKNVQMKKLSFVLIISVNLLCLFCVYPAFAKNPNQAIRKNDKNGDGKVSRKEWKKSEATFKQLDVNQDGFITLEEFKKRFTGQDNATVQRQGQTSGQSENKPGIWYKSNSYWQGPIIDAHSQIDSKTDLDQVMRLMDQAGVNQVILSTRFNQSTRDVLKLALRFPDRIIPAAKTKTKAYMKGKDGFPGEFYDEIRRYDFKAMAEVIMWHAQKKGVGAGKAVIYPDDSRLNPFLETARKKRWPFIAHVEFAGMGTEKTRYMKKFKLFLSKHSDLQIGLIHMGQLSSEDAAQLLTEFSNLFFITSHCNSVIAKSSKLPWTRMFEGVKISQEWKNLLVRFPDRFVLAFDNVFYFQWNNSFIPQVLVWRKALLNLPESVAHALSYGNAERLWRLEPASVE